MNEYAEYDNGLDIVEALTKKLDRLTGFDAELDQILGGSNNQETVGLLDNHITTSNGYENIPEKENQCWESFTIQPSVSTSIITNDVRSVRNCNPFPNNNPNNSSSFNHFLSSVNHNVGFQKVHQKNCFEPQSSIQPLNYCRELKINDTASLREIRIKKMNGDFDSHIYESSILRNSLETLTDDYSSKHEISADTNNKGTTFVSCKHQQTYPTFDLPMNVENSIKNKDQVESNLNGDIHQSLPTLEDQFRKTFEKLTESIVEICPSPSVFEKTDLIETMKKEDRDQLFKKDEINQCSKNIREHNKEYNEDISSTQTSLTSSINNISMHNVKNEFRANEKEVKPSECFIFNRQEMDQFFDTKSKDTNENQELPGKSQNYRKKSNTTKRVKASSNDSDSEEYFTASECSRTPSPTIQQDTDMKPILYGTSSEVKKLNGNCEISPKDFFAQHLKEGNDMKMVSLKDNYNTEVGSDLYNQESCSYLRNVERPEEYEEKSSFTVLEEVQSKHHLKLSALNGCTFSTEEFRVERPIDNAVELRAIENKSNLDHDLFTVKNHKLDSPVSNIPIQKKPSHNDSPVFKTMSESLLSLKEFDNFHEKLERVGLENPANIPIQRIPIQNETLVFNTKSDTLLEKTQIAVKEFDSFHEGIEKMKLKNSFTPDVGDIPNKLVVSDQQNNSNQMAQTGHRNFEFSNSDPNSFHTIEEILSTQHITLSPLQGCLLSTEISSTEYSPQDYLALSEARALEQTACIESSDLHNSSHSRTHHHELVSTNREKSKPEDIQSQKYFSDLTLEKKFEGNDHVSSYPLQEKHSSISSREEYSSKTLEERNEVCFWKTPQYQNSASDLMQRSKMLSDFSTSQEHQPNSFHTIEEVLSTQHITLSPLQGCSLNTEILSTEYSPQDYQVLAQTRALEQGNTSDYDIQTFNANFLTNF